ncbi:anthranilate synthase component I family protein [Nocardioides sp. NPDC127503]|uniref:anthranilate synthase component I family protein n=1 Tax=Nocardioides sp. NPDC127503 TaxID=3154516 RepID=UPI003325A0F3
MNQSIETFFARMSARHSRCFWLDGAGGRTWSGSRSMIGWLDDADVSISFNASSRQVTRHTGASSETVGDDVFNALEHEIQSGPPDAQWFGYFGYSSRGDLPAHVDTEQADAVWMRPSRVHVFEHSPIDPRLRARSSPAPVMPDLIDPREYRAAFAAVQEQLHAGNSYEVNLTYRVTTSSPVSPTAAYLRLRSLNPAPYAGFIQHDVPGARSWLLSSSPERYARIGDDRVIEARPIKGTTPRGQSQAEDQQLREQLARDPKFRAENLMIVDLLRNDLATVCQFGTVTVPDLMFVESYESVHQLVSTVQGQLRPDMTTVGAIRKLFPAGSMTGAPKRRTMEIIRSVEPTPRGPYAGAFGWIGADGRADLGVVIRSLTTAGDGQWRLGTGGGIIVHSTVEDELAESSWKAARLLEALAGFRKDEHSTVGV